MKKKDIPVMSFSPEELEELGFTTKEQKLAFMKKIAEKFFTFLETQQKKALN